MSDRVDKFIVVVHTYDDIYNPREPSNDSHYVVEFITFDAAHNYYKNRGAREGITAHIIMPSGEVFTRNG